MHLEPSYTFSRRYLATFRTLCMFPQVSVSLNNREDAEYRTAGFSYGIWHVFIVIQ